MRDRLPILQALQQQANLHSNLVVFDPFDILCAVGSDCPTEHEGVVLFRDKDHLSNLAVQRLAPDFEVMLKRRGLL